MVEVSPYSFILYKVYPISLINGKCGLRPNKLSGKSMSRVRRGIVTVPAESLLVLY